MKLLGTYLTLLVLSWTCNSSRISILQYIPDENDKTCSGKWSGVSRSHPPVHKYLPDDYREETSLEQYMRIRRTLGLSLTGFWSYLFSGGNGHNQAYGVVGTLWAIFKRLVGTRSEPMLTYVTAVKRAIESDKEEDTSEHSGGTWRNEDGLGLREMHSLHGDFVSHNISLASTLSKLSYLDLDAITQSPAFQSFVVHEARGFPVFIEGDSKYDQQVFLHIFEESRTAVVVLRGTQSLTDIQHDLDYRLISIDRFHAPQIQAHAGFVLKWHSVAGGVTETLHSNTHLFDYIIVTGHSLGGGIATLAAPLLREALPDKIVECISFGAPRVGNSAFVTWYGYLVDVSTRVINERDPITQVPIEPEYHHVHDAHIISSTGRIVRVKDTPAHMRFSHAMNDLDWNSVMSTHDQHVYDARLTAMQNRKEQRLKRRSGKSREPVITESAEDDTGDYLILSPVV